MPNEKLILTEQEIKEIEDKRKQLKDADDYRNFVDNFDNCYGGW